MQLKSLGILMVSGCMLLVSCGAQMGSYSETDGLYYDPNKDIIPEPNYTYISPGSEDTFIEQEEDSQGIIEQNLQNQIENQNRYNNWNGASQSDWGSYAGTESNYYMNNWGWGMGSGFGWGFNNPWMWGNRWGMGAGFGWGWNDPFMWGNGWGMNFGFGWNDPWMWGGRWGMGMGFGWGGPYMGYNPYWDFYGWGYPGYFGRPYNYKRSGSDQINRGNNGFQPNSNVGNRGFNSILPKNSSPSVNGNSYNSVNKGFRRGSFGTPSSVTPNNRPSGNSNSGFRRSGNMAPVPQQPSSTPPPKNEGFRNNSSGSGGFGGGNSGNSGGGRSSGGGFRGGFR